MRTEMQPSANLSQFPLPTTERDRLRELASLRVMHTPREEPYDGLVEIAAALFDAPMALMSLVDETTQWFKARVGIEVCETSRDIAFCAHAIMSTLTLVVEDAALDPRFKDNPLVTAKPFIRFYVGAPLVTSKGECVGTLCVADTRPRQADPHRLRLLERLASQVVRLLETARFMDSIADLGSLERP